MEENTINEKYKKEIIEINWGRCPKCKDTKMIYQINNYQAGIPGGNGTYIEYLLDERNDVRAICPKCLYKVDLVYTIEGICSKEHAKEYHIIEDEKTKTRGSKALEIGYIQTN